MESIESTELHLETCTICNDAYTPMHAEIRPGLKIYVCEDCIEAARYNFIWVCLQCGRAYLHPKKFSLNEPTDEELEKTYMAPEETRMIQTIEMCRECDPNGTERYMKLQITAMEC